MSDRYFVTARNFDSAVIWYVQDSRVITSGEGAIVARCSSEADAHLVRDALNEADERRSARNESVSEPG